MIKERLFANFAHPQGLLGRLAGRIMAKKKSNTARGRWAIDQLAPKATDRVLEVGYGPGVALGITGALVSSGTLVGVDSSDVMKAQASRRNRDLLRNGRLVLYVGDAQDLDPTLKDFDLIYGLNVWQFWSDQTATVNALAARLVPGGRLALLYMQPPSANTTAHEATKKLTQQFETAGLHDVKIHTMDFDPPAVLATGPRNSASKRNPVAVNLARPGVRVNGMNKTHDGVIDNPIDLTPAARRAFADWYRSEYHQVVALVYVLSGSKWAAEELTQDAFVEAHRKWGTISNYDDPGAWVRKVAVNKARSWGRRKGAEARAYAKHTLAARELPAQLPEGADEFWSVVRKLPDRQAQIIALHYLDDRPVDDIANLLGISAGTVKTQLHRARKTLSTTLAVDPEEES